jgi:hypothetical protein
MGTKAGTKRVCEKGHTYYKSSDCPVCPTCSVHELGKEPRPGVIRAPSAPARRALEAAGIASAEVLSTWSEAEVLALHGMGPASLPALRAALKAAGLAFRKDPAGGRGAAKPGKGKAGAGKVAARATGGKAGTGRAGAAGAGTGRAKAARAGGAGAGAGAGAKGEGEGEVEAFLAALKHPRKAEIQALRALILGADRRIAERVKWNAPSFHLADDFATFKLRPEDTVQIVFHTGAKVKASAVLGLRVADPAGLLRWAAKDRALATFTDMEDIRKKGKAVVALVKAWIGQL